MKEIKQDKSKSTNLNYLRLSLFGFLVWLIPFIAAFPFVSPEGTYNIDETFFRTIMIIVSGIVGVYFMTQYFKNIEIFYWRGAFALSIIWLVINWGLDILMVYFGVFDMDILVYFQNIGLRYVSIPIYAFGIAYILSKKIS